VLGEADGDAVGPIDGKALNEFGCGTKGLDAGLGVARSAQSPDFVQASPHQTCYEFLLWLVGCYLTP
jgi:hypothetical protein